MTVARWRSFGSASNGSPRPRLPATTVRCARWILQRLAIDKMSVSAVAKTLGLSWETVNTVAAELTRELVFGSPDHLDGVRYLGVDEHKWKHRRGQGEPDFVTVLVDLTRAIDGTGPSWLLDMVPGRSAEVLRDWLQAKDANFRSRIQVVAMDGFAGYRAATADALPAARAVMDPFHVVHLVADKLTLCRRRIRQDTRGHRGPHRRSALRNPPDPADPNRIAHRQAESQAGQGSGSSW